MAHKDECLCVDFNSLGTMLATGGGDCKMKVWDAQRGVETNAFKAFNKPVTAVSFSLDNEYLGACSVDKSAKLWRTSTMRVAHTFTGHKDTLYACGFAYSVRWFFTGSSDRTIKSWDYAKGFCANTVRRRGERVDELHLVVLLPECL